MLLRLRSVACGGVARSLRLSKRNSIRRGCGMRQDDASVAGSGARQILARTQQCGVRGSATTPGTRSTRPPRPASRRRRRGATSRTSLARRRSRSGLEGRSGSTGQHADGLFFVPFATTEGTLVTTYQYGMRAITEAGGANTYVLGDALDITPCFVVASRARPSPWPGGSTVISRAAGRGRRRPPRMVVSSRFTPTSSAAASSRVRVQHRRRDGHEHGQPGGRADLPSRRPTRWRVSTTTSGAITRATRSPPPSTCSARTARRSRST